MKQVKCIIILSLMFILFNNDIIMAQAQKKDTINNNIEQLTKQAKEGDSVAQYQLGCCYYYGKNIKKNKKEGLKWLNESSKRGYDKAKMELAKIELEKTNIEEDNFISSSQDDSLYIEEQKNLAKHGNIEAQNNLGDCYYYGNHEIKRDYKEAIKWYRKAAERGYAKSQYMLGYCYYHGQGVEEDHDEAILWYRKAADQGYEDAQKELYRIQLSETQINDTCNLDGLKDRANSGDAIAQIDLGDIYYYGKCNIKQNYKEAVKWYKMAAEQGNSEAQACLGNCYYFGIGINKNYEEAVNYYRKSANQGDKEGESGLGDCYYFGRGVNKNYKTAVEYYTKSANKNKTGAQYMLGWCYYHGQGVKLNKAEGIRWYKKAAVQKNKDAQHELNNIGETW
jgi:TPR repeat protein